MPDCLDCTKLLKKDFIQFKMEIASLLSTDPFICTSILQNEELCAFVNTGIQWEYYTILYIIIPGFFSFDRPS